ncbi:MAG TPA: hypothetical protein PKC43_02690 [Phycisphaerales bacterium]|nr:hypothetical protein [Phycisphaerales bacterium]HMP36334.1 hypothetical protein [Phycisphaerales bacterium]
MTQTATESFLASVRDAAIRAGVFGAIEMVGPMLRCAAPAAAAEAWYRLRREEGRWWVELVTPDRWLSESVESDLMHYGDPIEELIEEELVNLGGRAGRPQVQHFRSEDLLYTFRTPLDGDPPSEESASRLLLAYEAAFRELGDIEADEEE